MALALLILVLALIVGGVGLAWHALWWLLLIAVVLLLVSAVFGWNGRSTRL